MYPANFKLKGLLCVHNAIRRDAKYFNTLVSSKDIFDNLNIDKVAKWFDNYSNMLHIHHSSEDNIFFPALIKKSQELENFIFHLEKEHLELDTTIDDIKRYLKGYHKENDSFIVLNDLSVHLMNHIYSHADKEEENLIPATTLYLTTEEQNKLEGKLQRHISFIKVPFLISWIMYELPDKYRDDFFNSLPTPFKYLYKKIWKNNFSKYQQSFN